MNIIIERGKVVKLNELPEFSIALDGFVQGPEIDAEHNRFSFDHHSKCLRFCTTSACMQAWTAVLLGLDPEAFTVYANDVDGDVCAAIWALKNPSRCNEPMAIKLINAIGLSDCHGGAFEINGMKKVVEWVLGPETDCKRNNDYSKISDFTLNSILESVLHRMDLYVNGEAQIEIIKQQKHGEYKIISNENDWVLAESQDPHVFSALYQAGFNRIVLMRTQDDGSIAYTLAKKSDFITNFPITKFYDALNSIEAGWGGGSSIGGAPRHHDGSRSKLQPGKVTEIINSVLLGAFEFKVKAEFKKPKAVKKTKNEG